MSNSKDNYEDPRFVSRYAKNLENNAYNALMERPATLGLIENELFQQRILDIGCGPGIYLDSLISRGAICTAFDQSHEMVKYAKERHPEVDIFQYELSADMPRFKTESFDLLVAPLVLDYIEDWPPLFQELSRILRPGGALVFSVSHPAANYANHVLGKEADYFAIERKTDPWKSYDLAMDSYRRPLSAILSACLQNGFILEKLNEPRPIAECQAEFADDYQYLSKNPTFLSIRLKKPGI